MTKDYRLAAQIDLDAAAFNLQQIQKITDKQIIGVVKADAYGHGAVELAALFLENGVDFLAVAVVEEAMELRRSGIACPILVLDYLPRSQMELAVANGLRITVYTMEGAQAASRAAQTLGKPAYIHLKVDTGMGRLGFQPPEAIPAILAVSKLPGLVLEGLFTHFAAADEADKSYTEKQVKTFSAVYESLLERGVHIPMTHCANSAGVMDFSAFPFSAVRPGIILYGMYPSDQVDRRRLALRPILKMVTCINHLKTVPAGTAIGYGCTFTTARESRIATIPVGYADGFARKMQEGGRVLIRGKSAPIVGRVCMDQCMVDVTELPEATLEDEVVILGKQGAEEITAEQIAAVCGTIPYEITCRIGRRVPRMYFRDGNCVKTVSYV